MALFRNRTAARYGGSSRNTQASRPISRSTSKNYKQPGSPNIKKRAVFFACSALVLLVAVSGTLRLVTGSWTGARAADAGNPYYGRCMPFPALRPALAEGSRDDDSAGNGQCVKALQRALRVGASQSVSENGVFDAATKQAVINVQQFLGARADTSGTVGIETWNIVDTAYRSAAPGAASPEQIWQNGRVALSGVPANQANAPVGYIDSCALEGATTVFRGWAYDYDTLDVPVALAIAGPTGERGDVTTSVAGYRQADIAGYVPTIRNPAAPRDRYGFEWRVNSLQNDRNYTIGGVLTNVGPGVDTVLGLDGNYFPGGAVPASCTKQAPPPPPVAVAAPAAAPTPQPAADTTNHNPKGYIDSCEISGSATVFKGWLYDADSEAVTADLTIGNQGNQSTTVRSGLNYRTDDINGWLNSGASEGRASGPKRGAYGFEWSVTGLQNDRTYSIGGPVRNVGAGTDQNIEFSGAFSTSAGVATVPSNCLHVPQPSAAPPAASVPVPQVATIDRNPIGNIDSCELKDGKTVIYGWAYDPDGPTTVDVWYNGASADRHNGVAANIAGYRTAQINGYLPGIRNRAGTPLRDAYGFRLELAGLYKGSYYTFTGLVKNIGEGSDTGVEQVWSGQTAPDGGIGLAFTQEDRLPDDCLSVKPANPPASQAGGSGGGGNKGGDDTPALRYVTCKPGEAPIVVSSGDQRTEQQICSAGTANPGCDSKCQFEVNKEGCVRDGGKWTNQGSPGGHWYCQMSSTPTGAATTVSAPVGTTKTTYKELRANDAGNFFIRDVIVACNNKGKVYVLKTVTTTSPYGGTSSSSNACVPRSVLGNNAAYLNTNTVAVVIDRKYDIQRRA